MDPAGPDWPDPIPWPSVSTLCAAVDPAPRVPASGTGTQSRQTLQTLIRSPGGPRPNPERSGPRLVAGGGWLKVQIKRRTVEQAENIPQSTHR
jgi:hypothetical protein